MALTYEWNFGDGEFSNDLYPEHTYDYPGRYTVRFKVTDDTDGVVSIYTRQLYIYVYIDETIQRKTNKCFSYHISENIENEQSQST